MAATATSTSTIFHAFAYTVRGKVQGVFFRKYTHKQATSLHLVGWVQNTADGAVVGECQGSHDAILAMKKWLSEVGSPKSRIDSCQFEKERQIEKLEFKEFSIRR